MTITIDGSTDTVSGTLHELREALPVIMGMGRHVERVVVTDKSPEMFPSFKWNKGSSSQHELPADLQRWFASSFGFTKYTNPDHAMDSLSAAVIAEAKERINALS